MNRRAFFKAIGSAALLPILPRCLLARTNFSRRRPSDPAWPSQSAWKQLNEAVGGHLLPVDFPLSVFTTDPEGAAAKLLAENIRNPYYIGDQPGLTQTLGWVDAWATKPSVYAVAARNAHDIAEAVNFARENHVDLIVVGAPGPEQEALAWWRSVASGVTANAHCSVHVVRVPEAARATR